ncbi:helix-hairpin-helix domain-containing protein [Pseudonocardia sp. GCM10023141]|uniref:helix-hairpin-helix domain-containing protein n=1 Tax=Pseudonocardia sp. GCM10023141 TaxID=3252653 RepID=UPI0036187329
MARQVPPDSSERLASVFGPSTFGPAAFGSAASGWPPFLAGPEDSARRFAPGAPGSGPPGSGDPGTEPLPLVPGFGLGSEPEPRGWRRWVPRVLRGARLDPGRPGATALAVVAAGAAVVAAVGVWSDRPRVEPVTGLPAVAVSTAPAPPSAGATGAATGAEPPSQLVVSVSGKVVTPGLVQVPDGARVADVLTAAGGVLPGTDLLGLNPARRVADGEQIVVGVPPPPEAPAEPSSGAGSTAAGAGAAPGGKVNLNAAGASQLDALPGVGPVTAQRIVEWRTHNGRFARVEQLREIEGIGERKFAQLRDLVTIS